MFGQSSNEDSVFQSESVLSTKHTPRAITGRNKEVTQIAEAVRPLTRKNSPENLFVHGPAGVGKTTCVTHVLEQLEAEASVKTVHVNCWQFNTRASLLSQFLNDLEYMTPRKGKPVDELLLRIQEWLDKNRPILVVLDEFDQLQDQEEIIYDLHQCSREAETPVGIILTSNQAPSDIDIYPRSTSRLRYRTIQFDPYDQDALVDILQARANTAFKSGAVSDETLDRIAQRVAAQGGDCRHAIELLHRAGRIADREGNSSVTTIHAEQSFNPGRD